MPKGDITFPRLSVEIDPETYRKFFRLYPRGLPSTIIRNFVELMIFAAENNDFDGIHDFIYNRPPFERKQTLARMYAEMKEKENGNK